MKTAEFRKLASRYPGLRVAIIGDFCLDRYLEIDPERAEISIETGLVVHNVVRVRSQPGGAGTILNNLCALGVGEIYPVGLCGMDGEGYELVRALSQRRGVRTEHFLQTPDRATFTYTKPLLIRPGKPPEELNRLDMKNWSAPSVELQEKIASALAAVAEKVQAIILLDQVDVPETGVVTTALLDTVRALIKKKPDLLILADSRRGLAGYPPVTFKMNAAELRALTGLPADVPFEHLKEKACEIARANGRPVFVTLSEKGLLAATPQDETYHVPAFPLRGEIDIVGAGDSVTANLTAALAAGSTILEALEAAAAASSIVIHQLGTTGTASPPEIEALLAAS